MHQNSLSATPANSAFLTGDLDALRAKIAHLPPLWARRWERFLDQARTDVRSPRWYGGGAPDWQLHGTFAHLITGRPEFAAIARADFLAMVESLPETLRTGNQDHDTWIYAAALARRAASLDWIWDAPRDRANPAAGNVLSSAEQQLVAEHFITEAHKYPYVVLQHRVPSHANNQGVAMALDCVITGYLFGIKHGNDSRARHLLEFGLPHLTQQIALLPPGGYSGEGSTYIFNVADPLMALTSAVLEEISGEAWFHREFWPNRNSAARVVELDPKLIPPSGLLPAWDQHGYHLKKAGCACAYVAHRTGDPAAYYHFLFGPGWELSGNFAWMHDDHVWQWIWMPDPRTVAKPAAGATCYPNSWAEPRVAGALLDRQAQLHLFQTWDISGPRPVRGHMNPNAISLEAWGSVLTVDGNATDDFALNADPRMHYMHLYSAQPKIHSWASGSLGAHSTIWIDGAIEHTSAGSGYENLPAKTSTGFLLRREDQDAFQILSVDAGMFYRNAYDVTSMIRNSALLDNAFWIILDQLHAATAHDFTWQLVLRTGATATPYGARLTTPEHVVLDVINLDPTLTELLDIEGYPSLLEKRCHHLRKTQRGAAVEFLTVLIPQLARREIADWTDGWQGTWQPATTTALAADAALRPMRFDETYYGPPQSTLWLRRSCTVPAAATGPLLLELPRPHEAQLWINGVEIPVPFPEVSKDGEQRLTAVFVDVTAALSGQTTADLILCLKPVRALGTTGWVKLHQSMPVSTPVVERLGADQVRVRFGTTDRLVELDTLRTAPQPPPNLTPAGENPITAAHALLAQLLPPSPAPTPSNLNWNGDATARGRACSDATRLPLAQVEEPLIACLTDADWFVRMVAIRALGVLGSRRAIPLLCEILRTETPERINADDYAPKYRIKEMAVMALSEIGDPATASELVTAMRDAGFYGVRRIIPGVLQKLGDRQAIAELALWVTDPDGETANACKRALASIA